MDLRSWLDHRTFGPLRVSPERIARAKAARGLTVTVCLPALDEERTVGTICRQISERLMGGSGLVDELLVIDSGSRDATVQRAIDAGATVHRASEILPHLDSGTTSGKGDVLWKSLAVAKGDILVWIDSDIRNFDIHFVTDLVAPLLEDETILMTKAFYSRPLVRQGEPAERGGRVTELVARPLLNLLHPELAGVIQPLSGECASYRGVLSELPFVTGYAVETMLLVDLVERFGPGALAQVDLGTRVHRNRDLLALGRASFEIIAALLDRTDAVHNLGGSLLQFVDDDSGSNAVAYQPDLRHRPPMAEILRDEPEKISRTRL
ncbi:MAG: glucosyl-3-phosphoglycerate synthase [Actinomycetota bacterium]